MRWPLRFQVLLPMASLMVLTIVGVAFAGSWVSAGRQKQHIEEQLRGIASTLAAGRFPLTDAVLEQTSRLSGAEFLLVDAAGGVLSRSRDDLPTVSSDTLSPSWQDLTIDHTTVIEGQRYFHVAFPWTRTPRDRGAVLHIFYSEALYDAAVWDVLGPLILFGGIGTCLAVILASTVAARVTRPLNDVCAFVDRVAAGEREIVPPPSRNDEVRDLALAVNRMVQMLVDYEDQIRRTERLRTLGQLGGGIAHQIRNSVTGCCMALDLHQRESPHCQDSESLSVGRRQLDLMAGYLQRFLDHGNPNQRTRQTIAMPELLSHVVALVRPSAMHLHIHLDMDLQEPLPTISGDAVSLEQMLVGLAINGIEAVSRRAASNAFPRQVTLRAHSQNDMLILEVIDTGDGPSETIRPRLFTALVSDKPHGVGLGLAMAQRVAREHQGEIDWRREGERTIFQVRLPVLSFGEQKSQHQN
jgi:nitrogen-specific signal transduction histidine kinase